MKFVLCTFCEKKIKSNYECSEVDKTITKDIFFSFVSISGVPYALKQAGFVMGILLLIITALINGKNNITFIFFVEFESFYLPNAEINYRYFSA